MVTGTGLVDLVLNGLTIGMVYVLVAAGLSVIFGVMDVLNIAHGELLALGAYFAVAVIGSGIGGAFWLALIIAPLATAVLGMIIERVTLRRVYGRGHLAQILLTFGLLLIVYDIKQIVWGKSAKLFAPPRVIGHPVTVLGSDYSLYSYFIILSGAVLVLATWMILHYTKFGLVVRAGSQDRGMVRHLGIDIDRYYTLVFGFGAALAAFGGVVLGGYQNVNPEMGNTVIIPAFVIVVLGGLGSFRGAVVGGLAVGLLQSAVSTYLPLVEGLAVFLLMIGILLIRPHGLFGAAAAHTAGGRAESSRFAGTGSDNMIGDRFRSWLGLATVVVLALVPVFGDVLYSSFLVVLFIQVLIWALFALSLDIILGYGGLVSLGHALFYGAGAYAVVLTLMYVSPSVFVALTVALTVTGVLAWAVGHLAIRVSGVYFVMITLAFAELAYGAVFKLGFTGGSNGLFATPPPLYGVAGIGIRLNEVVAGVPGVVMFTGDALFYYILLVVVVGTYLGTRRIMHAPFGSVLQSIRESEQRSRFIGYDVQSFKRRSFVLSGTIAGLSGAMFALYNGYAAPALLHWINSGDVIIMAVLGGTGTLYGPMLGAGVFVIVKEQLSSVLPWWRLLLGTLFVLVVLFLPQGLISLPGKIDAVVNGEASDLTVDNELEVKE
jgi:branched-chain amino acid transport system permease protein